MLRIHDRVDGESPLLNDRLDDFSAVVGGALCGVAEELAVLRWAGLDGGGELLD
jgi:hypothetical protein